MKRSPAKTTQNAHTAHVFTGLCKKHLNACSMAAIAASLTADMIVQVGTVPAWKLIVRIIPTNADIVMAETVHKTAMFVPHSAAVSKAPASKGFW